MLVPRIKSGIIGDLGNLNSDVKGNAVYSQSVEGKLKHFLGRAVIIHALPDDLKSQPTGNSGDRIACGVIVASMPPAPKEEVAGAVPSKAPEQAVDKKSAPHKAQPAVKK